ncbi:hypothetical protein, partial [Enterococcus faecium]
FQKLNSCDEKIQRRCDMFFATASISEKSFLFLAAAHSCHNLAISLENLFFISFINSNMLSKQNFIFKFSTKEQASP